MYIPETVAKGMEADSVADGIFKTQEPERAKQMKSAMYAKLEKDGAKLKETEDQTDWVFQTAERNWLDLFQIHHGVQHELSCVRAFGWLEEGNPKLC